MCCNKLTRIWPSATASRWEPQIRIVLSAVHPADRRPFLAALAPMPVYPLSLSSIADGPLRCQAKTVCRLSRNAVDDWLTGPAIRVKKASALSGDEDLNAAVFVGRLADRCGDKIIALPRVSA